MRKAYPDKFVVVMGLTGGQIDDRIIAGEGVDASTVQYAEMRPESAPKLLTTLEQKLELLSDNGVDIVYLVHFDAARSETEPAVRVTPSLTLPPSSSATSMLAVMRTFFFGSGLIRS